MHKGVTKQMVRLYCVKEAKQREIDAVTFMLTSYRE